MSYPTFRFIVFSLALLVIQSTIGTNSAQAQPRCESKINAALDDSERPVRVESANPNDCAKETLRFTFAPPESRTFPFNGQTLVTQGGVTITQLFQRDSNLNFDFSYVIGDETLRINVDRLSKMNPATNRIKLLPVRISIQFKGQSASFIFTGEENESELAAKLEDFFAIGHSAQSAGFDKASERLSGFAKRLWNSFAGGDQKKSVLPLKASFPTTELTYNVFVLSFALQNKAFDRFKLCENPKTLRQSLMVLAAVKDPTIQNTAKTQNISFSEKNSPRVQDFELEASGLCCVACEIVHCITDNHWADCLCCLGGCKRCPFPWPF